MNIVLKKALPCALAIAVSVISVPAAGSLAALADTSTPDIVLSVAHQGDMSNDVSTLYNPTGGRSVYTAGANNDVAGDGYITTTPGEDNSIFWGEYPALSANVQYYIKTIIRVHNFDADTAVDSGNIGYMKDEADGVAVRFGEEAIDSPDIWVAETVPFTDTATINQGGAKDHEVNLHVMGSGANETNNITEQIVFSTNDTPLTLPDSYIADNLNEYATELAADSSAIDAIDFYWHSLTDTQLTTFENSSTANGTVYNTLLAAVNAYDSEPVDTSSDSSSSDVSSATSSDVSSATSSDVSSATSSDVSSESSDTDVSSEDTDSDSEDSTDLGTSDEGSSSVTSTPATSSVATETNADTGDSAVPASVAAVLLLSAGAAIVLGRKIRR
jgi:hypothetical protein